MAKSKAIGGLAAAALKFVFRAIAVFVNRITHEPSRLMVEGARVWFLDLVTALSDSDPENETQVRQITNKFFTESPFAQGSRATIELNLAKVNNEKVRTLFMKLLNPAYNVADLLTDENPENTEQLITLAQSFGRSEDGLEAMVSLFGLILDDEAAAFIAGLISTYIETMWADDAVRAEAIGLTVAHVKNVEERAVARYLAA